MADYRLDPDGPHSDEYTRHVAQVMAGTVRILNHATRTSNGVTDPATVHDVLGSTELAIARMDQMLRQLGQRLNSMLAAGEVGDDSGHPTREVRVAQTALSDARAAARTLATRLSLAHSATSGLHLRNGGE